MNRGHKLAIACVVIAIYAMTITAAIAQSSNDLPSPLMFTVGNEKSQRDPPVQLAYVDPKTQELVSFYQDTKASGISGLLALQWSPDGELLMIFRQEQTSNDPLLPAFFQQLCILNRSGTLQSCFDDPPYVPPISEQLASVSWSSDSQNVFFVTSDNSSLSLVEGDAQTGKRVKVIFTESLSQYDIPPSLSWTSDLGFVTIRTDDNIQPQSHILVNLQTNQRFNLDSIVPSNMRIVLLCRSFSPQNSYLTLLTTNKDHTNSKLLVIDKQGTIIYAIDNKSGFGGMIFGCPVWQEDESAFYFYAIADQLPSARIFKFSLKNKQVEVFYQLDTSHTDELSISSEMALSSDNSSLAFSSTGYPNAKGALQVDVLHSDGHIQQFYSPYFYAFSPLWSPVILATPPTYTATPYRLVSATSWSTTFASASSSVQPSLIAVR